MMNKRRNTDDKDIVNTLVKKQKMADKIWPDEMTPEAAKRIEKLQEKWRKQDVENQRREAEEYKERFNKPITLPIKYKNEMILLPQPDNKPLTVKEAKALGKLQDKLKKESETANIRQVEEIREREKKQEPIIKAIKEQTETIKAEKKPKRAYITRKPLTDPFRPRVSSTPGKSTIDVQARQTPLPGDADDIFEKSTLSMTPAPSVADELENQSIRDYTEHEDIGNIAKKFLARQNKDKIFGIYYDFRNNKLAIGSQTVTIENNDIILDNTKDRYEGTEGLWELLTLVELNSWTYINEKGDTVKDKLISKGLFNNTDYENYKDILFKTNAIYQDNNPSISRRPKASSSWKWRNLIADIYKSLKNKSTSGQGLLVDTNNPVEYKYIDDYKKLYDRIKFIQAEEEAGNNNFHNEKMAIVKFINDRMEKVISKPEGIKYITQCLTALPEKTIEGGRVNIVDKIIYGRNLGLASERKKDMILFHRR